ncbi:hypothetical protein EX30DRAFT_51768 [Ascodesmis nigricans]|uniref:Uncharacterized protein n=1 Tax=Ascodesmis nigricans TaxID=341454 RepID=A0A4S2MVD7_9PEZI|nr:hypothetical protein EX30DRAFT_51768 [Ascodesmis nigricans]
MKKRLKSEQFNGPFFYQLYAKILPPSQLPAYRRRTLHISANDYISWYSRDLSSPKFPHDLAATLTSNSTLHHVTKTPHHSARVNPHHQTLHRPGRSPQLDPYFPLFPTTFLFSAQKPHLSPIAHAPNTTRPRLPPLPQGLRILQQSLQLLLLPGHR